MVDFITSENADVVVAWATVGGMIVGLLTALAAVRQLSMIRADSHDRTRPYVQLDVVPGLQGPGSWDLIIENTGATTALDLIIDAGEIAPHDDKDYIAPVIGDYLQTPKALVPGARRRVMWGFEYGGGKIKAGVLEPRTARVSYLDERQARRKWRKPHRYETTFTLGDSLGPRVFPAPSEGPRPTGQDMLAHIDQALRTLNLHVGELRR